MNAQTKPTNDKDLAQKLLDREKARQAKIAARRAEAEEKAKARAKIVEMRKAAGQSATSPEEKAADFKRLAKQRTAAAIKRIDLIGHLSAKASYVYTPEQVAVIRGHLESAVARVIARFETTKTTAAEIEL